MPPGAARAGPELRRFIRAFAVPIVLGLDRHRRAAEHRCAAARRGRQAARGLDEPQRRTRADRDQARRRRSFEEYDTSSSVMIVLEGDEPLGAGRARVLRRDGAKAQRGHHPRAARAGLLG